MNRSTNDETGETRRGFFGRLWHWFRTPSGTVALGTLLSSGVVAGVLFWGGFHWALELTNTERFCITCHEMRDNVYQELKTTVHFSNRSGVRATCPDCHVPKEWQHKIVRKIRASNELYHHLLGSVETKEKFEAKRLKMAMREWARMKRTDSRECRNCHQFEFMDYASQEPRAADFHKDGLTSGKTCIDCHRGIAHALPPNADEAYKQVVAHVEKHQRVGLMDYLKSLAPAAIAGTKSE